MTPSPDTAWSLCGTCALDPDHTHVLEVSGGRVRSLHRVTPGPTDAEMRLPPGWSFAPGFIDAHTHLLGVGLGRRKPDLSAARSVDEALERLSGWLREHPGRGPVIAEGWDQSNWPERRAPLREEIDRLSGQRPVALRRVCGHVAVLNTAALARLGTAWPNLDESTGLALESLPLALGRLWPPNARMLAAAATEAQDWALRHGVTWIHEMGHGQSFRAFGDLARTGRLRLRISHYFNQEHFEAISELGWVSGAGDRWLRVAGIKIFLDGSIGGRSAAFRDPYPLEVVDLATVRDARPRVSSRPVSGQGSHAEQPDTARSGGQADAAAGERGLLLWSDEDLLARLREIAGREFRVALHAIGDAAIEQAIRVVETLQREGHAGPEWAPRLEHAEALAPDLLERAVAAGFWFSMQPNFTVRWQHPGGLYEGRLGWDRTLGLNPYRSAFATGRLVLGSDCMPVGPRFGWRGLLEHPQESERLSPPEVLLAYGLAARSCVDAPFLRPVDRAGSLMAGAIGPACGFSAGDSADLVLLDDAAPPRVRGVAVNGQWQVWDDGLPTLPVGWPAARTLLSPAPGEV